MPQPTPYARNYDFTNFQEQFPDQSLPAAPLDANLDAIGISIGQIITRGTLLQRDDGALRNKIVTPDTLSTTVLALLGSSMDPRGDWAAATDYAKLSLVEVAGATYISTIAHTSSSDFATDLLMGWWMLFSNPVADSGSSFFQEITGTGAQTVFTMTADLGIDSNAIMFFLNTPDGFDIKAPSYYTINGTQLTLSVAPGLGIKGYVFAPSLLLGAASSAASAAQAAQAAAAVSQSSAATSATLSQDWATKTNGIVAATDYSSKAWAVGGTNVTNTATRGPAKDWATKLAATVDTAEYSAKEYAVGDLTATGGSAKAWAVDSSSPNGTSDKSSKSYALDAAASAAAAASSAAEGLYENIVTITNANSPYVPAGLEEGTMYRCDTTAGNIVINLSALATYGEDMKYAFVKIDNSANTVTINRGGTDTINGQTSLVIGIQYETHALLGDLESGTWADVIQAAGIADNSVTTAKLVNSAVTYAKMQNVSANKVLGSAAGGVVSEIDFTAAARALCDDADAAAQRVTLSAAGLTQTGFFAFVIELPKAQDYNLMQNVPASWTVTRTTTKLAAGTCTVTPKINTTAIAGGAHSATTTESNITRSSSNAMVSGDDLVITIASPSSADRLSFSGTFTYSLAS